MFREKEAKDTLLFIYETDKGKIAVKMDYEINMKNQDKKRKVQLNIVRTASVLSDISGIKHLEILWGTLE